MQVEVTTASDRAGQRRGGGQGAGFPTEPALGAHGGADGGLVEAGDVQQIVDMARFQGVQRGDELLTALKAPLGVLVQQFVQQRLIGAQSRRQFRGRRRHMHHGQREAVLGGIGDVAGEHLVEQHAEAVQIGAGIHPLAANLFRAHVAWRADRQAGAGHDGAAAERLGDTEIG